MAATTPMVAVAWLKQVLGVDHCGTELPDSADWGGTSWTQAGSVVGGNPALTTGQRRPVVQFDCWAVDTEGKPLWTVADQLGEVIVNGCFPGEQTLLLLPDATHNARLDGTVCRADPRRERGDPDGYARVRLDVQLYWLAVPK